ncbi:hypothetical protein Moror_15062 [Moniliophthora roreri MCA 2997]|uniref:Uncharacterized protein n=1 Tax=Moniliophthora roreri (strain MCA 2997) TaxID=1381753 RepID=V2WRW8_MONRO|nr:hypothetical protein Moror_15062 [Moniliophthora roreri MCA 2997]
MLSTPSQRAATTFFGTMGTIPGLLLRSLPSRAAIGFCGEAGAEVVVHAGEGYPRSGAVTMDKVTFGIHTPHPHVDGTNYQDLPERI